MNLHDLPSLMTLDQTATFLRVDHHVACEAARNGELPLVVVRDEVYIDTTQLLDDLGVPVEIRTSPGRPSAVPPLSAAEGMAT